eukprot:176243-Alexandrium_andersonii.AAC.1
MDLEAYRVAAEKAYLEEDAKMKIDKARRVIAKKFVDPRPGQWVMYYRVGRTTRHHLPTSSVKGMWLGPARILLNEYT